MVKKKTNEQWKKEVKSLVGDDYIFLEEYKRNHSKILVKHEKCGGSYKVTPGAFKQGNRCPYCNPYRKRTTEEFKDIVHKLADKEYTVITEYTGHHDRVKIKHSTCGIEYYVAPSDFIKGRRCKDCHFRSRIKATEDWLKQVYDLVGTDYEFLEEYHGDDIKLRYKHSCGAIGEVTPNNFINGTRCSACKERSGETNIRRYLTENNHTFQPQKSFEDLRGQKLLSYDFYIPSHEILIEFQGIQHYYPVEFFGGDVAFKNQKKHDYLKREYADNKGIKLIEIPYTYDTYEKVKALLDTTMSDKH